MVLDNDHKENEINELSLMKKVDDFLKLADFYHVERCENEDCSNCLFFVNIRYLYVQNTVHKQDSVAPLEKFCKMKFDNYHSIRLLFCSLRATEKKRVELGRDFQSVLTIWNKPIVSQSPPQSPPPQTLSQNTQQ